MIIAKATLVGANLSQSNLRSAALEEAFLENKSAAPAEDELKPIKLDQTEFNSDTTWPTGFDPIAHGALRDKTPTADTADTV